MPSGQPELVGIFHPGIRAPAFADDRANVRAGNDVGPRRWRGLARLQSNDILATVGCKTSKAVRENTITRRQRMGTFSCRLQQWLKAIRYTLCRYATFHLLDQS